MITLRFVGLVLCALATAAAPPASTSPSSGQFPLGLPTSSEYFPIAVWLQNPKNAQRYREIGINLYVGLWQGPTDEQLDLLEKAGLGVICHQNAVGMRNRHRRVIVGWMHGDEPDNAQSLGEGRGYGPPISPARIVGDYRRIRQADPLRPVLLNLGQGVAWDAWHGRGVRTNHPEDYPQYIRGGDIISFDIYPVTHDRPAVTGKLEFVGRGVQRLREWTDDQKPVWACIESTHISNPDVKPTPGQVRNIVWMALIHGARGIIYFSHQFKPNFIEAGILADHEMAAAVARINSEIRQLAPVLNSPTVPNLATVTSPNRDVPIAHIAKEHAGGTYIFAIPTRAGQTEASFSIRGQRGKSRILVIGENRTIDMTDGRFTDRFDDYSAHLYAIAGE